MPMDSLNPRLLGLLGISVVTIGASYYTYTEFSSMTSTDNKSVRSESLIQQQTDIPSEFGIPPFQEPPEPEVREIIKYIDNTPTILAPPPLPKPKPKDVFSLQSKKKELSAKEKRRREILKRGYKSGQIYTVKDVKSGNFEVEVTNVSADNSRDKDFSSQKLGKSIPTYPVDLERTLTATRFIPVVLYTELKSELSSQKVIAQVEQDIYGDHGRKILIPKGSKIVGAYQAFDEIGDTRLQIAWNRILTPNGINITIASETVDQEGASGSTGIIDKRHGDRYGAALLFSTISALAQLSVDTEDENQAAAADAFTGEFGQTTATLIQEGLDMTPRVNIPRGTRLNVSILTDIWFKEPKQNQSKIVSLRSLQKN
jgi:type IV secretory pathway VirB10-like protein